MFISAWQKAVILVVGLTCLLSGVLLLVHTHLPEHSNEKYHAPLSVVQSPPSKIELPSVDVSLDIVPGAYNATDKTWSIADGKANFATNTSLPSQQTGMSLLYAHDRKDGFADLEKLADKATAKLHNSDGIELTYTYHQEETKIYNPEDTSLFKSNDTKPRLVLLTCNDWLSSTRIAYTFYPEKQS